jgi:hypothetical protein
MRDRGFTRFLTACLLFLAIPACQEDGSTRPRPSAPIMVSFLAAEALVREPVFADSGVSIPVVRGDTTGTLEVSFQARFSTAGAGDVRVPARSILFAAGQETSAVYFELLPDSLAEGEEAFTVSLDSTGLGWSAGAVPRMEIRIDDRSHGSAPTVSFLQPEIWKREGTHDGFYPWFRVPVVRSDAGARALIDVSVSPLTAGPEDFQVAWDYDVGVCLFAAGAETAYVNLQLSPDALEEGDEQFALGLRPFHAGYALGRWTQLTVHIEDIEVHHDPMPSGWPMEVGDVWTYRVELDNENPGGYRYVYLPGTAAVADRVRYRGRDYQRVHVEVGGPPGSERADFYFATAGDSLLFVPASDTGRVAPEQRNQWPWVFGVFNDTTTVDRTYYQSPGAVPNHTGVILSGRQATAGPVAVPVGSWDNVMTLRYDLQHMGGGLGEGSDSWTFYLAAGAGPVRIDYDASWWHPDWAFTHFEAYLVGHSVRP